LGITRRLLIQGMSAVGLGWVVGCDEPFRTNITDSGRRRDQSRADLETDSRADGTVPDADVGVFDLSPDAPYGSYGSWLRFPRLGGRRLAASDDPSPKDPGLSLEWSGGRRPAVVDRLARWLKRSS
jgi:hypothetical protein